MGHARTTYGLVDRSRREAHVRFTPYLDSIGVTMKDDVPDGVLNVLDSALYWCSATVEWGEHEGRRRKPCPENPVLLAGQPLGQYHCAICGTMQLAGEPHFPPGDYELETGREWPAGYEDAEQTAT